MSKTVDERIVAAKFDASDFEKGVDKTIKKLDELKDSLDLKDATKGVKEFAEKTEASTNSMSNSLQTLTERFTTFKGMIKQKILGGLAEQVSNVFLSMERSVLGFIKSISTDQISAGMSKYEQILTSVRTLAGAGVDQDAAYEQIGLLRDYADQTSYSLTQMTDALAKMSSSGVDVKEATKSVEGIANACAAAGINATDAQRAFYNLSQAYGKGTLNYTDYKSLELLNMTTKSFKENLLEAAVEAKTLKKMSDGTYKTINTTDKKVKAGKKVTLDNLSDMLKYDFMNKEAMNKLFGEKFYFDEKNWEKYKNKYIDEKTGKVDRKKAIEEAKKDFGAIAVDAYLAAREARSFTDVMNTLKDSVSTGWSTSFEYLFGKLDEAKDFFTELVEGPLAEVIFNIGEYRNAIMGFWSTTNIDDNAGGGKVFRDIIMDIADALGILFRTFQQILPGFDELDYEEDDKKKTLKDIGLRLYDTTLKIRKFSERIKEAAKNFNTFMHEDIDGVSRIERIRKVFSNLASVFSIIGKVVSIAFTAFERLFNTLSPVMDGIVIILEKVTEPLVDLKNNTDTFKEIEYSVKNLFDVLDKITAPLTSILSVVGEILKFMVSMAIDTWTFNISLLSDALEILVLLITGKSAQMEEGEGIINKLKLDFEGIKEACTSGLNAVKEFFSALIADIKQLLGLTEETDDTQEGGVFANLTKFFETNEFVKNAIAWVDQGIVDVSNCIKSIPERVAKLGKNIYDTIWGLLFYEKREDVGGEFKTNIYRTELGEWLNGVITSIKDFFVNLPQKIIDGVGTVANWVNEIIDYWFGKRNDQGSDTKNIDEKIKKKSKKTIPSRFDQFVNSTVGSIKEWFDDIPNKIQKAMKYAGDFFSQLWAKIDEFLFGKKVTKTINTGSNVGGVKKVTYRVKQGFSSVLDNIIKEIKKFIKNIPTYLKQGIKGAGDFISTIIGAIFGKPEGEEATKKDVEEKLNKPFLGVDLTTIINNIKEIGSEILNQILRIFTGSDDIDENMEWFSNQIAKGIKWIRTKAKAAFDWVLEFLPSLPSKIADLFSGKESSEKGSVGTALDDFAKSIGEFITGIPGAIADFFTSAIGEIDKLWENFYDSVIGNKKKNTPKKATDNDALKDATDLTKEKSKWYEFVEKFGKMISTAFEKLPKWIAEGLELAVGAINGLLENLTGKIKASTLAPKLKNTMTKVFNLNKDTVVKEAKETTKEMAEETKKESEDTSLLDAVIGIGQGIYDLITQTIPSFIQAAWEWLGMQASEIWKGLSSIFSGNPDPSETDTATTNICEKIKTFFKDELPAKIENIWKNIKSLGVDLWSGIAAAFGDGITKNERQETIKTITSNIKEVIVGAFESISNLFSGKSGNDTEWKKHINAGDGLYKDVIRAVEDQQRQANERLSNETSKSGSCTFITDFKNGILEAFGNIGPTILNGLSSVLGWLSDVANYVIEMLTGEKTLGEQITEVYGNEKPELQAALERIGESLKNFFLKTLPKFIGAAIGTLIKEMPEWFNNLFGAMETSMNSAAEDSDANKEASSSEKLTNTAKGLLSMFENFLSSEIFKKGVDTIQIIAILIAITTVLSTLKDLFSMADEAEVLADTMKWTALTVGLAVIATVVELISDLSDPKNEEKMKNAISLFDKLKEVFSFVSDIVMWIGIMKIAGSVADVAGSVEGCFESVESMKEMKVGVSTGDDDDDGGNGILGSLASMLKGVLIGGGTLATGFVLKGLIESTVESFTGAIQNLSTGLEEAVNTMMPFIDLLKERQSEVDDAIKTVENFSKLFTTFYNVMGNLYEEIPHEDKAIYIVLDNDSKEETYMDAFIKSMGSRLELFEMLSLFIYELSRALSEIDKVNNMDSAFNKINMLTGVKFKKFLINMLDMLAGVNNLTKLNTAGIASRDFNSSNTVQGLSGLGVALDYLSSVIKVFGESLSSVKGVDVKDFREAMGVLLEITGMENPSFMTQIAEFTAGRSLTSFGRQLRSFSQNMVLFFEDVKLIKGFEPTNVSQTYRVMDGMIYLTQKMANIATSIRLSTNEGFTEFPQIGSRLSQFSSELVAFFQELDLGYSELTGKSLDLVTTEKYSNIMDSVANLFKMMNEVETYGQRNSLVTFGTYFEELEYAIEQNDAINAIAGFVAHVNTALAAAFNSENYKEMNESVGKTMATQLFTGMQNALNTDPDLKIKPVLDIDDIRAQLRKALGMDDSSPINFAQLRAAVEGSNDETEKNYVTQAYLNERLTGLETFLTENVVSKIATVSDFTKAFTGIKIVTDTGVLAGEMTDEIDEMIGNKIWLIERNVTPSVMK